MYADNFRKFIFDLYATISLQITILRKFERIEGEKNKVIRMYKNISEENIKKNTKNIFVAIIISDAMGRNRD